VHVLVAHGVRVGPVERRVAGEHLVEEHAERVHVAAPVEELPIACSGLM
jgi:hypothetical protein